MSEQISIIRSAGAWVVSSGRFARSRLWFYAPGLEVYVKGEDAARSFPMIANVAMNEALARHIPAASLKTVPLRENSYGGQQPPARSKPVQKPLFPGIDDTTKGEDDDTV